MSGYFLAVISAICYSAHVVSARRATLRVPDPFLGVIISSFIALFGFAALTVFTGGISEFVTLSWQGYMFLIIAGITHFTLGRFLYYGCIQRVGGNLAGAMTSTNPIYPVFLAIILFGEDLTWQLAVGASLIVAGCALASLVQGTGSSNSKVGMSMSGIPSKVMREGILLGLGAGFFFGVSNIPAKYGLMAGASPMTATFISYIGACAVLAGYLTRRKITERLFRIDRVGWFYWSLAGLALVGAQGLFYTALNIGPVSVVSSIIMLNTIFVLPFSFLVNRNVEIFKWNVIVGVIAVVVGAMLLY